MKSTGIILILLVATLALPLGNSFAVPISNPPTNLISQSVSSTQINLSWTAPVNATQNAVNGYKIEQDSGCDGSFAVIVTNNTSTSYLNTGLNFGTCYAYRVSALNSAGASAPSNVDFDVTFMVPAIPTGLSAKTTTTSAKISWNAPANNGYIITGYQIQRNGTILVQNTANTRLSYVDLGLKPLSTQTYRVAAWNIAGLGPFSANITAKTSNQTGIDNLGQAVSDFVQKRNELLKKQREEYMRIIQQCHDKTTNATGT
ncbi:MAG: fibronectin type III domain-containing protein, partial [Thaumarchaeota archaeon]|nr:fibronectin type III domain-containing protein [Nitrososphaerota archaeon]